MLGGSAVHQMDVTGSPETRGALWNSDYTSTSGDDAKDADHYLDADEWFRIAVARQ